MEITHGNSIKFSVSISERAKKKKGVTIPFRSSVSLKKAKPTSKCKKRVGDVWISGKGMSLTYILAVYMTQSNIKRLAGFYHYEEGKDVSASPRFIFVEVIIDGSSVLSDIRVIDEHPKDFLDMEGKSYDQIFGNVADMPAIQALDIDKLYQGLIPAIRPTYVAAIFLLIIAIGVLVSQIFEKEETPPKEVPLPAEVKIPDFSVKEKAYAMSVQSMSALNTYKDAVMKLDTKDMALKEVSISQTSTGSEASYRVDIKYQSYYPFKDSKWDGNVYVVSKTIENKKTRSELEKIDVKLKSADTCLKSLMPYKIIERNENAWIISVNEETDKTHSLLNNLYRCPIAIQTCKISEKEMQATIELYTDAPPIKK